MCTKCAQNSLSDIPVFLACGSGSFNVAFMLSGGRYHAPHEGEIEFLIVHRELGRLF